MNGAKKNSDLPRLLLSLLFVISCSRSAETIPAPDITTAPMNESSEQISTYTDTIDSPETGSPDELVDLERFCPGIVLDIRYATTNNFTGQVLYESPKAYLRRAAAEKLRAVQAELREKNLGLKIYDAYRPLAVQWILWDITPDRKYIADPAKGSKHNRGAAVDLTIIDGEGQELPMGTGYDNFTEKAHHTYRDFPQAVLKNRELLKSVMERHGFRSIPHEWWHYDDRDWRRYEVMDIPFTKLEQGPQAKK